ncbi:MAG: NAD-dependent epimerase/dehydratase family protein [Steroidobacteraceae bacterium]
MKVLVTGGSGFVGGRLVRRLAEQGFAVRATHRRENLTPIAGVEWWPLPALDDEPRLAESVAGCDAVVHLAGLAHQPGGAANRAAEFRRINTEGTRLLARAAVRGDVRRFVFVSSIAAVCTRSDTPVDDWTPSAPTDPYGCSKFEAEQALVGELKDSSTDWCILRPPLVYGPGNPGNMRRLIRIMESGLPLPFGSIRNRRSFMFVDNLVDAIVCVLRHEGAVRSTYVLSDGNDFSTPELVSTLAAAAGYRVRLLAMPVFALMVLGRAGDAVHALLGRSAGIDSTAIDRLVGSLPVDGSRFRHVFDWNPPVDPDHAFQQMGRALLKARQSSPD